MAVKEMVNNVVVEGILSEIGLERSNYVKNGIKHECIRGEVKVRVNTPIEQGGEVKELEVPIRFFTRKLTNAEQKTLQFIRNNDQYEIFFKKSDLLSLSPQKILF